MNISSLINRFYHNEFSGRVFHTLVYCLQKELKDCQSVLDIGCGPNSPLWFCQNIKYSVGIEPFKPYLEESKKRKIHTKYLDKKIEELDFAKDSFDAVIMVEVLEHLSKNTGLKIMKKAEKWAKRKVIITTPNGFFPMGRVDNNIWQKHLSGWNSTEFKKLGFSCHGLAGIKFFYKRENETESIIDKTKTDIYANIRFKPKIPFYFINALCQTFSFYFPKISFELFAVKEKCIKL